jgi:hypothetical protein
MPRQITGSLFFAAQAAGEARRAPRPAMAAQIPMKRRRLVVFIGFMMINDSP